MRWLCLFVVAGCVATPDVTETQVAIDKNGFAVEKVELFVASNMEFGVGPMTPELFLSGRPQPMAQLWSPHQSLGYAIDDSTYPVFATADGMMVAVGWRDGQAALAGHAALPFAPYGGDPITIKLAPDDVEVWTSHACVRYTDGVDYIYLLAHAGCW